MSKYTTEVRFICETAYGLTESKGATSVDEILDGCVDKVFNFSFPIFDEAYRKVLEKKILKHYYTREIGEETVGLWKLRMNSKLNEIMPYYNKLYNSELLEFNPLYTHNITRTHKTEVESASTSQNDGVVISSNSGTSDGNGTNGNTSRDLYSDTPQGAITNLEKEKYLTNARKIIDAGTTTTHATNSSNGDVRSTDTGKGTNNSTENYLETVVGFDGKDASELLLKYRKTFLNIDMMVIEELEELFFQLW